MVTAGSVNSMTVEVLSRAGPITSFPTLRSLVPIGIWRTMMETEQILITLGLAPWFGREIVMVLSAGPS